MHRCSSAHGNMVGGPCSCGYFHNQSSSFSMLFAMPNNHKGSFDESDYCPYASPSSSVDCTLSLGTPSTRLSNDSEKAVHHERRSNNSYMPNFCWDILQSKHASSSPAGNKSGRGSGSGSGSGSNNSGPDPLLARRCANCDTTSTPLWRNGPRGPKSLCNACGIRFKKEERRATAAASTSAANAGGAPPAIMESQHMMWGQHPQGQKMQCLSPPFGNEYRQFIEDDDRDSDSGIPFLSWRLNVTDRPSLVHDFTR